MAIEYDSERGVYVDTETGDYMTEQHVDREFHFFVFVLFDINGKGKVGIETQQFATKLNWNREKAKELTCFIKKAWIPDVSQPQNRIYISEDHPLIAEISRFLFGRRKHFSRSSSDAGFKVVFDCKSSVQYLKEQYPHG